MKELRIFTLFTLSAAVVAGSFAACASPDGDTSEESALAVTVTHTDVLTQHNDNQRTGANLTESVLTPANVTPSTFGRLYKRHVEGQILAQPLYVSNVLVNGVRKNMVYVATAKNNVYGFDADDMSASPDTRALVQTTWNEPPAAAEEHGGRCSEQWGPVGISSTPVIDKAQNAMFVVTRSTVPGTTPPNGVGLFRIHRLSLSDLSETVPARTLEASEGDIPFLPTMLRQRTSLLLANGLVYLGFGSFGCDASGYHGWILAYDENLKLQGTFSAAPNVDGKGGAGIWQSGGGLASDASGAVYAMSGNAANENPYGQAFLKFTPQLNLLNRGDVLGAPTSWTPQAEVPALNAGDVDIGAGAPLVLPNNRVLGGGKAGRLYMLDTATWTQRDSFQAYYDEWHSDFVHRDPLLAVDGGGSGNGAVSPACLQTPFCYIDESAYDAYEAAGPNIHGSLVYLPTSASGGYLYAMPEKEHLKAFRYLDGTITHPTTNDPTADRANETVAAFESNELTPNGMPSGALSISANGATNGIVWASYPKMDAKDWMVPGRIMAFDASTLRRLWSDEDDIAFAKFVPPTVADGKVFRATFGDQFIVYGLKANANDPADPCVTLTEKYRNFGGPVSQMGPMSTPIATSDGLGRYVEMSIAYVQPYEIYEYRGCAHEVHGGIGQKWVQLGREKSVLGYPVTDETMVETDSFGHYNNFQYGMIYWTPGSPTAFELHGYIAGKWVALGRQNSPLGYPTTDETESSGRTGRYNYFQYGAIYYEYGKTEAFGVYGPIFDRWAALSSEYGMGYPTSDVLPLSQLGSLPPGVAPGATGQFQWFEHGYIYVLSGQTQAHEVR